MPRTSRQPRRQRLDDPAFLRNVERAIEAQRENVILPDSALNEAATVKRSDVDAAIDLWREANEGHETARLLDGPAREDEPQ